MNISPNLYVSESLAKRKDKIIKKIAKGKKILSLYCITNPANDENLFDIYYYNEFFQKVYRNYYNITIFGIAKTRDEAYALIETIVKDCLQKQGDCNVKEFIGLLNSKYNG